ncbi:MAG: Rrf2 family transcriptional regulator [Selenomonas sp.]|nr:Rrf2 family transcriptional regulator [Selenomonas sp.]
MVSTRGRYALRVMLDLAEQESDRFIPLADIAKRQGISQKYLEIVIRELVKHKLLRGLRGKRGGYMLTRSPEEYTVGEILELTEGKFAIVSCTGNCAKQCDRKAFCRTLPMWQEFNKMTHDYFFGITLADLLGKQEDRKVIVQ